MDAETLPEFTTRAPAMERDIAVAEVAFGHVLPEDYKAFLLKHDGGEGFIGEHYFVLWSSTELVAFNQDYQVQKLAPGLISFASTGGGEGFAFDMTSAPYSVTQFPFIGLRREDALPVARSFTHLLERMSTESDALF